MPRKKKAAIARKAEKAAKKATEPEGIRKQQLKDIEGILGAGIETLFEPQHRPYRPLRGGFRRVRCKDIDLSDGQTFERHDHSKYPIKLVSAALDLLQTNPDASLCRQHIKAAIHLRHNTDTAVASSVMEALPRDLEAAKAFFLSGNERLLQLSVHTKAYKTATYRQILYPSGTIWERLRPASSSQGDGKNVSSEEMEVEGETTEEPEELAESPLEYLARTAQLSPYMES